MEKTALGNLKKNKLQVLVDSDAFIGKIYPDDAHFQRATALFNQLNQQKIWLVTTSLVIVEVATVLSHKAGQSLAKKFLNEVIEAGQFPIIHITEDLHQQALTLFRQQTQKGTSVTDCANVTVVRQFSIPTIFSFDQVYPKKFGCPLLITDQT